MIFHGNGDGDGGASWKIFASGTSKAKQTKVKEKINNFHCEYLNSCESLANRRIYQNNFLTNISWKDFNMVSNLFSTFLVFVSISALFLVYRFTDVSCVLSVLSLEWLLLFCSTIGQRIPLQWNFITLNCCKIVYHFVNFCYLILKWKIYYGILNGTKIKQNFVQKSRNKGKLP